MPQMFKVRDILVQVSQFRGGGGVAFPADDGPIATPLTPHTPVISVVAQGNVLTRLGRAMEIALKEGTIEQFAEGKVAAQVTRHIGEVVIGGALLGGGAAMPGPDCDASLPTPITPIGHAARVSLQAEQLPRLKEQLQAALAAVEAAENELRPTAGEQVKELTVELEGALKDLQATR
jgi:hypothetical protein